MMPGPMMGSKVICPVCLTDLDWTGLPRLRWDNVSNRHVEIKVAPDANAAQRARAVQGAVIKCPDPLKSMDDHYLPADYGRYGQPVVLGLVGATSSGKTHLLSAMAGAIERDELFDVVRATSRPLDEAWHHDFMTEKVQPLLTQGRVLQPTEEKVINFADAWLIGPEGGAERPVALFDVAGGEMSREQASMYGPKNFLQIADGYIFVVDPAQFGPGRMDNTFKTVLDLLQGLGRLPYVSAAVVLSKADLRRFDDPVTRWLRTTQDSLDPGLILQESADVFAYLDSCGAQAWTRPYALCGKATLHVASATGGPGPATGTGTGTGTGEKFPRGVAPRRVLSPLISLLAMTGVLTSQGAQQVGI